MRKIFIVPLVWGIGISVNATTLKGVVKEVLDTNPIVKERLHNYRATRADLRGAEAGYYPTLDLETDIGRDYKGEFTTRENRKYDIFENALILRQNLFHGFSTQERVNYQQMRTLAAAYSYLEKANDVTLQTIKAYIDLLRYRDLLNNARKHVRHIKKLEVKVMKAYKAGVTKMSEVSKVRASLSSARNNMLVARNRLANALYTFRRITGRTVSLKNLHKVSFNLPLPKDQEKATIFALQYNPSLKVGKYNIMGAEALYQESKSKFYPTIDAELSAKYSDEINSDPNRPYPDREDGIKGMIKIRYNIFNGGADEAARVKKMSKVSQEMEVVNDLRRQVMEGMDLSWSTYELSKDQIPMLRQYRNRSRETLKLYWKEYNLGERSLLDLLATESDLKRANDELIDARYNMLLAKFRILDAMGLTMASVLGNVRHIYKKVGLFNKGISKQDTLPASYDRDRDGVPANADLCADSKRWKNGVRPSGCRPSINALDAIRGVR
jgi:adhesin transport system outer membrane protein